MILDLILPYLRSNSFGSLFHDAGRRHKKPVSETKDFITLGTDSMLSQFLAFLVPLGRRRGVLLRAQMDACTCSELCYRRGTLSIGNEPLIARSKQDYFLFQGRYCLIPQSFLQTHLKRWLRPCIWHTKQAVWVSGRLRTVCPHRGCLPDF